MMKMNLNALKALLLLVRKYITKCTQTNLTDSKTSETHKLQLKMYYFNRS